MQLTARQRRFQHIASVHRAFGLACADHRMQFVNKDDGLSFVLREFLEYGFKALLELAAILGTGHQHCHIEGQHPFTLEAFRHFTVDNALCEPFDNGGLADTRLANQHGVVLGASLQHLNDAADFVVATDHRVELAHACPLGQIDCVFLEGFALAFGFL